MWKQHEDEFRGNLGGADVDGLKAINDAHGHAAGDELLRNVGAALRTGLRSYDLVVDTEATSSCAHLGHRRRRRTETV